QECLAELDRVAREGARLQFAGHAARRYVARLVARGDRDRRAGRVVVGQGDQRDARALVGRSVRERRERARADGDVGALGIARAEGDELDAAGRHVARGGEDVELRWREGDGDGRADDGALAAPEWPPEIVAR